VEALAAQLEDETTPRAVVADLVPPSALGEDAAVAANKVVSALDRRDLFSSLTDDSDLDSLLLNTDILRLLQHNDYEEAIRARGEVLHAYLTGFIRARTACEHEDTPPLDDFVFDDAAEGEES
jgi:hypothetical protein avisC_06013